MKEEDQKEKPDVQQKDPPVELDAAEVLPVPEEQEELDQGPDLKEHFELFKLKKEAQQKCDALL